MISNHGEHEVLALLDGELQIDNVVFIATTNYPERLDRRIVNRPSRFDIVKLIDMPNAAARKLYLTTKNPRLEEATIPCGTCAGTGKKGTEGEQEVCGICKGEGAVSELEKWIVNSKDFSIAHLKELIVSVEVFEVPLDTAISRLEKMINRRPKSTDALPGGSYGEGTHI
jgi:ATP-dependent 26S proteasome regulatory subunit